MTDRQRGVLAADGGEVGVGRLVQGQVEDVAQQAKEFGAAIGLHFLLEDGPVAQGYGGLGQRAGLAQVDGDRVLVDAGGVHQGPAGAAGVGGEGREGAGVVPLGGGGAAQCVEPVVEQTHGSSLRDG
ncbi:hypothetical protein ACIGW5_27785 [Streptomyces prasinus]|uniref:hypothetical protein n=1 Tax=Streptomyces prasinus TaxID=67345 RepID=UPI0037D1E309